MLLCIGLQWSYAQEPRHVVTAPTALNILYRGIENPLEITVEGVMDSNLVVSFSNVTKAIKEGDQWIIVPANGRETIVTVSHLVNGTIQLIDKRALRIVHVPDPHPYFGGKTGYSSIKFNELMAAAGVIAKMENFYFDLKFSVVSYAVEVDTGSGKIVYPCSGPYLNLDARKAFSTMYNGGFVDITNIEVIGPDSMKRQIDPIELSVIPKTQSALIDVHIKNQYRVSRNIFRSAQPSKNNLQSLHKAGFRHVLNLRRNNKDNRRLRDTPLTIHHLPVKTRKMTETDIVEVLKIIDNTHYNVLVHCKHGADRTGVVIAAYRIIYENWTKEEALIEMQKPRYGYHERLFPHLATLIEELDVTGIRNELGVDL